MVKLKQAVLVEGRYDKNTLLQVVDATVFVANGFGILHDAELVALLREAARTRGLVIFTDADGAGFVIRNYLRGVLPKQGVLHAYIPELPGREARKREPGKEGLLGVEGMTPEIILKALRDAGALEETAERGEPITRQDLFELGLMGGPGSSEKRKTLLQRMGWPHYMSTGALLDALNMRYTRGEFLAGLEKEPL